LKKYKKGINEYIFENRNFEKEREGDT